MNTHIFEKNKPAIFGNMLLTAVIDKSEILKIPTQVRYRNFVYILTYKNQMVYVGRTKNLRKRLCCWKNCRNFDKVYLCEYLTHEENCKAERDYINYYKPKLNFR